MGASPFATPATVRRVDAKELNATDAPAVAAVFAASRAASMPWLPVLHSPEEDREYFAEQLESRTGIGVEHEGALVGFAIAHPGWLDHLYVAPDCRGLGLGTTLITTVRQRVPGELSLWVFARNTAALGFYDRLGALEEERTDGAGNEEHEPDVRLLLPA